MRFIKRIIFIVVLLLIAFFVYRLISPKSAQELLFDLTTFSNDTLGTHFSLSGETLTQTWESLLVTGVLLEETWALQEFTGDEELLLTDSEISGTLADDTAIVVSTWPILPSAITWTTIVPKTTQTSSSNTTSQEKRDYDTILKGFWR